MRRIIVKDGQKCPLCPDHWDDPDDFVWSDLLKAPICRPCSYEIHNAFLGHEENTSPDYYPPMVRILELTGLTFPQAKFVYLRSWLLDSNEEIPDCLKELNPLLAARADLHAMNIRLDARVTRICERALNFKIAWHDDPTIFSVLTKVQKP